MSATGFHPEPSAKAPWTRTIVLTAAYAGDDAAKAAPVRRARTKRFILQLRCSLRRPIKRRLKSPDVRGRGVLKLTVEFSRPTEHHAGLANGTLLSSICSNAGLKFLSSYDQSNLFFLHRPQSDSTGAAHAALGQQRQSG